MELCVSRAQLSVAPKFNLRSDKCDFNNENFRMEKANISVFVFAPFNLFLLFLLL